MYVFRILQAITYNKTQHMLQALYRHRRKKFTQTWTDVASKTFPVSNYTEWGGRGKDEGKILKQIPPLSRRNTRQHSTKWIWNRRNHSFKHAQSMLVSMFQRTKSEFHTQQKWLTDQGNCVSSENQLRIKIKSFSQQHFI